MKLWQILAVVAVGIVCGIFEPGRFTYALGQATLFVFLPPLLFEAAWNLNYRAIVRQWPAIATLAGPGVLLTAADRRRGTFHRSRPLRAGAAGGSDPERHRPDRRRRDLPAPQGAQNARNDRRVRVALQRRHGSAVVPVRINVNGARRERGSILPRKRAGRRGRDCRRRARRRVCVVDRTHFAWKR